MLDDLTEDPEARTGTGEGEIWSQGEAEEPNTIFVFISSKHRIKMGILIISTSTITQWNIHVIFSPRSFSLPVELGVFPPNHGETNRASGEAPTYIGDGEGW